MPDMSGFDVCRALKADAELCMVPVLFLSGSATPEDKVKGLDLGAVDYVTKPFDAFELRARVRAALRTKHLQDLLIEHAHIDPLTGLPNRRALMERLQARMGPHRSGTAGGCRSSWPTSTISSGSTTPTATTSATSCCRRWRQAIARECRTTELAGAVRRRRVRHRGAGGNGLRRPPDWPSDAGGPSPRPA